MRSLSLVASPAPRHDAIDGQAGQGFRVLVCGGEDFSRVRAARELARHGFSVVTTLDAKAARNARCSFDVVVAGDDDAMQIDRDALPLGEAADVVDAVLDALWERKSG